MDDRRARVPRRGWITLAALLLLAGCSSTSEPAGTTSTPSSAPATEAAEQFTPAVMQVMSTPRWFTGSDGRVHLVYELQLTNGFPVPATVTDVTVRDADSGATLETLTGDGLQASMSLLTSGSTPTVEIPPSSVAVVWIDAGFDDSGQLPSRVDHSLTVTVPPGLPVPGTITYTGASAEVERGEPTVIAPPLTGSGWIAAGSCCDGPHRRSVQPINNAFWLAQRFAIDFNKIDENNLLASGDPNRNENWFTYDQPVLAVADAEVVVAQDGLPDQVPDAPTPVTIEDADGNYVILKLAEGVYAFYAHLKPGSVTVAVGDRVTAGQEIARTGNSGSSTGTHLHFQLMDRPSALVADGLPYEFDAFTVSGRSPALDQLMTLNPAADPVPVDPATAGPRTDELPLGRDVVEFPTS